MYVFRQFIPPNTPPLVAREIHFTDNSSKKNFPQSQFISQTTHFGKLSLVCFISLIIHLKEFFMSQFIPKNFLSNTHKIMINSSRRKYSLHSLDLNLVHFDKSWTCKWEHCAMARNGRVEGAPFSDKIKGNASISRYLTNEL